MQVAEQFVFLLFYSFYDVALSMISKFPTSVPVILIRIHFVGFHIEDVHNSYSSSYIIRMIKSRRMRWAGHVAHMREMRNAYKMLFVKRDWRKLLGRPGRKWENNIKMDLRDIGCGLD
jgi:hypothetical protein